MTLVGSRPNPNPNPTPFPKQGPNLLRPQFSLGLRDPMCIKSLSAEDMSPQCKDEKIIAKMALGL